MDDYIIEYLPLPKKSPIQREITFEDDDLGIYFKHKGIRTMFPMFKDKQINTDIHGTSAVINHLAIILCYVRATVFVKIDIIELKVETGAVSRRLSISYLTNNNISIIECQCLIAHQTKCNCIMRPITYMKYDGFMTNPNFGLLSCNNAILIHANDAIFKAIEPAGSPHSISCARKCRPTTEKTPITYDIMAPHHLFKICICTRNWLKKQNVAKWLTRTIICELALNNDFVALKTSFVDMIMATY
jgi:hypothetical protein